MNGVKFQFQSILLRFRCTHDIPLRMSDYRRLPLSLKFKRSSSLLRPVCVCVCDWHVTRTTTLSATATITNEHFMHNFALLLLSLPRQTAKFFIPPSVEKSYNLFPQVVNNHHLLNNYSVSKIATARLSTNNPISCTYFVSIDSGHLFSFCGLTFREILRQHPTSEMVVTWWLWWWSA